MVQFGCVAELGFLSYTSTLSKVFAPGHTQLKPHHFSHQSPEDIVTCQWRKEEPRRQDSKGPLFLPPARSPLAAFRYLIRMRAFPSRSLSYRSRPLHGPQLPGRQQAHEHFSQEYVYTVPPVISRQSPEHQRPLSAFRQPQRQLETIDTGVLVPHHESLNL